MSCGMMQDTRAVYSGSVPAADSNDYTLFDSQVACGNGMVPMLGWRRVIFTNTPAAAGTLKIYRAVKGGTYELAQTEAFTAAYKRVSHDIVGYDDVKLVWTNGGSAQTGWTPSITFTPFINPGA